MDTTRLVRLEGNTRPEANPENDRGRVPDALPLEHLQLLLKRPPERELALQRTIEQLHDHRSPDFHRWLDPAELGRRFGLAQQDVDAVVTWLKGQGFAVNTVYPSTRMIDFSGTAGQVRSAFHSEIHFLQVGGESHIANMSDPQVPAALAPVVAGVVALHDFRPHALHQPRADYTVSSGTHLVVPADLATIYNLNPLFGAGYTGQNQTVAVIEDSNVYNTADWTRFRQVFGLSGYSSGSLSQVHPAPPSGTNNCGDPGATGDQGEATLDVEWASAAAPNAAIELASCAGSSGVFIALQNLVDASTTPPAIISISYGECEALEGAAANSAWSSLYQQAVAQGVSVFVSAGDEGAASCDADQGAASHGIGVSGLASTPYNVAVGGTDFGDSYAGSTSTYWSSTNTPSDGSALSYIPEIPWNDSCASTLISTVEGYAAPYGSGGFCNSAAGQNFLSTASGSGGPSGCVTGAPAVSGVVGGSCAGTPKPSWQSGVPGIPADGVRDLPDLSLFAANGVWGHYYVYCWSNTHQRGGAACSGTASSWSGAGGTSFAAPILAGVQALVNQRVGTPQGNPNPTYYALAASQSASGLSCNSSLGNTAASGCVFYDVTLGDMDVNCLPLSGTGYDCYLPSGTNGVLSLGSGGVLPSGLLSYALTVGNSGPQAAANVVVTTVLPAGLVLVVASSSPGCSQGGQTVTCTISTLAGGSTAPVTIVIQPGSSPAVINLSFAVSSSQGDLDPANNSVATSLDSPGYAVNIPVLPPWAELALGLLVLVVGTWRAGRGGRGLRH
ncbi:MAG: protease pro-enzyme activation domain-containing protein [Nevskia sp.]|nr:protease pro-enzyme activation domain-containing protein [Nevskia sp.]